MAYDPGAADIVAVTGRTSPDYVRVRQKDGSYVPETYSFGKGGDWPGTAPDASIDKLTFFDVAHVVAYPLAGKHYYPSMDPAKTKLLIMVYWGTTHVPLPANESPEMAYLQDAFGKLSGIMSMGSAIGGEQGWSPISTARPGQGAALAPWITIIEAENDRRRLDDLENIRMLGYDSWYDNTNTDKRGTAFEVFRRDLWNEIEDSRYFVVLMAYDFQLMWKEKKHRLLWETRFSIRQQHHQFDEELPSLAQYASRFFGQDSGGLVRDRVPLGQVEIGAVKNLGEAEAPHK